MNNITVQQLKIVYEIKSLGSMTKASEKLLLSQSALSHQIKDLEFTIGKNVFNRIGRKLILIEIGNEIYQSSEKIIEELKKLDSNINKLINEDSGIIKISTECYSSYNWLPKIAVDFGVKFPNSQVKIITEATVNTSKYLNTGELDIAITSRKNIENNNYKYTKIFDDKLVVLVPKNNLLSSLKKIKVADFKEQTLLVYDVLDNDLDIFQKILIPSNCTPKKIIKLPLTEIILEMVRVNLGITVMANWLVPKNTNNDFVIIPLDHKESDRTWYMVSNKNSTSIQEKFIEFTIENLNQKIF
jgi:LysR family transcriptional regulator, regulator for metE and metH